MNNYNLTKILPHKPPMILLDDVVEYDLENLTLTAKFDVYPEKIFYDNSIKGINSLVGIEFMAQAIGCYSYFRNGQKEPKMGLLLGTRLFNNSIDKFELNETYKVTVKEVFNEGAIVSFGCQIFDKNKQEIQSATINAFQNDDIRKMFEDEQ